VTSRRAAGASVGIVLAATTGLAKRNFWILFGIVGGLAGSALVAGFAGAIAEAASGMGQELFNACILFVAVIVLGWSVVWMRKHGRELALRATEVGREVAEGDLPIHMLSVVVGIAVLREGSEAVLFLFGIAAQGAGGLPMLAGGLIGIIGGVAVGFVTYRGLVKIPAKHLFSVTSWLLVLLAAGMASQGVGYLVAADMVPALGAAVWDTSRILSERSLFGQLLHTLIGYDARPSGIQIVVYLATLAVIGAAMRITSGPSGAKKLPKKVAGATAVAALLLLAPHAAFATTKVYSPIVIEGEAGIETRGSNTFDGDSSKDGALQQIHEIEYAPTDRWRTALFGELKKDPGGDLRYDGTAWENIIQFFEQGEPWIDSGLYLEYNVAHQKTDADKVEGKLLLEKPVARFVNTVNLIFEKQVGSNASEGTVFGYAYRTRYRWRPYLEPAVEAFGEVGELRDVKSLDQQDHKLGPVILGYIPIAGSLSFYYELGWLFGLTDATAAHTLKWLGELEFRF
jgi:high-affinity iron transporter